MVKNKEESIIAVNNSAALRINSIPHYSPQIPALYVSSHVIALCTVLYNSNIKVLVT